MSIKPGDLIIYTYRHFLNSKYSTLRYKKGVFVREVKTKTSKLYDEINPFCIIKIEGNKGLSKIRLTHIKNLNAPVEIESDELEIRFIDQSQLQEA